MHWGELEFAGADRFEIRRRLGEGGMGVVYEALDREADQLVAFKTLKQVDAQALFRFEREFRAAQGLEHPNLVSLGELFEASGRWFFTMELIRGTDFLSHVRRCSGRSWPARTRSSPRHRSGWSEWLGSPGG